MSQNSITVTRAAEIEMSSYAELRSVDLDYHSYLGNGKHGSHTAIARAERADRG